MDAVLQMMQHVRHQTPLTTISVEIEALRYDWTLAKRCVCPHPVSLSLFVTRAKQARLTMPCPRLALASDVVFVSKDYVRDNLKYASAAAFLVAEFASEASDSSTTDSLSRVRAVICPWGSDGVYFLELSSTAPANVQHIPTTPLANVVESIGAGDTFIGATIAALAQHALLQKALELACGIATNKCARVGLTIPQAQRATWKRVIEHAAPTHSHDEK